MIVWIKWRNRGIGLVVIGLLVAAFLFGRWTVLRHAHDDGLAVEAASLAEEEPGKQQVYYCSMHPTQQSTNPDDKCPICAMDLIPMPDDGDDDPDSPILRVSPRAAALMQVAVHPVERKEVHREVRLYGQLDFDETRLRTIAARFPGRLDRLFINFTGTSVAAHEPLAEIYSPPLITAQEELFQAIRAYERTTEDSNRLVRDTVRSTLEAVREKLRLLGLTPMQIDELETHRTLQEHITVHAPLSGVVTERHATEGAYVETGQPIYAIADLSNLWVNFEVYENDLAWLNVGDSAVFTTQAHPGQTFAGEVAFIDPVLDPRKRTVRVRIDVPNEDDRLKPGMFVRGNIHAAIGGCCEMTQPVVIPASAPLITGRRAVVYVQIPDDERLAFEGRTITLGPRAGDYYVVEDGLEPGDLVVVNGAFMIDSELQIRGRPSMMQPEGGAPPVLHDHADHGAQVSARPPRREAIKAPVGFAAALNPVYERYVELQIALADDDLSASREAAKRLHAAVVQVDASELRGDARDVWRVLAARLRADHEHVDHLDIEPLRERFQTHSNALIEMGQRFGYEGGEDLVIAYCPMAFDDAGAHWIQRGHSIANPYFGAMMFRCGDVIEHVGQHVDEEPEEASPVDAPPEFLVSLDALYEAYFEVQNALAADDFARSHTATAKFHEQVRSVDEAAAPEQWGELRGRLLTDAADVAAVDDIQVLRKMFEPWAMAMIEVSKTFRHGDEGGHFLAHCPMAFDWEGASWLQANEVINNPYFGATMLRCGTIREHIEPRGENEGGER